MSSVVIGRGALLRLTGLEGPAAPRSDWVPVAIPIPTGRVTTGCNH